MLVVIVSMVGLVALGDTVSMGAPSPVLTTHTRSRGELLNLARIKYLGHLRYRVNISLSSNVTKFRHVVLIV